MYPSAPPTTQNWGVPPLQQYRGGFGGRGRRGRGHGRGRGGRGWRNNLAYATQPPKNTNVTGGVGIPPQAGGGKRQSGNQQQRPFKSNPYTWFKNWNVCFSCGFDVPAWHNSQMCSQGGCLDGHQEEYNRKKYRQYIGIGHAPCMKGEHKNLLPQPGYEWGKWLLREGSNNYYSILCDENTNPDPTTKNSNHEDDEETVIHSNCSRDKEGSVPEINNLNSHATMPKRMKC